MPNQVDDGLADELVTFSMEYRGRRVVVEDVPARVDRETGEQFFAPETVERLRAIVYSGREPDRYTATPTYKFAA